MKIIITDLNARQVLSSRGEPTIEVSVVLNNYYEGISIVPSGASKGKYEACEIKDNDSSLYQGKSVFQVVKRINEELKQQLVNKQINSLKELDDLLIKLDGTKNKNNYGGNALLGISISYLKALSKLYEMETYRFIGGMNINDFPLPLMNVINGGAHVNNSLDIQEYMIVPVSARTMEEAIRMGVEVYYSLKQIAQDNSLSTSVGDEGGFAFNLKSDEEALDLLMKAIIQANYAPGIDFKISLDVAASEWKRKDKYYLPKAKKEFTSEALEDYYLSLIEKYPLLSIEDPFDQEDYSAWQNLTKKVKEKLIIVGDDLFTTNKERLQIGIENDLASAILIKPNQIGTISETLDCISMAKKNNLDVIISHRSGDSEDPFVSDLAYGVKSKYVKFGAPCRSERTAKYNRLLKIEEEIKKY